MIQKSTIQQENQTYLVNISYADGTGETKEFASQTEAEQYLITQEEQDMAKDNDKNTKLDATDPHTNAPGEIHDTPEKAASEMTPAEAEDINSNVNPAPVPAGAETGASQANAMSNNMDASADDNHGAGNLEAPHPMPPSDKPNLGQQVKSNL